MRVALFITCLADSYYPRAGVAVVKVLEHLGCHVELPAGQTCCGQPLFNNGYHPEARRLAERMIEVFAGYPYVVTPSGSCAAMIREHYPQLFAGDPKRQQAACDLANRTFEFTQFLVNVLKVDLHARQARLPASTTNDTFTYHYSCHLRGLGITDEAVRLMQQIEGLEYAPLANLQQCCGFGGTFAVKYPQISGALVRDKVAAIAATGARTVVVNDAGCTMNISGACRRAGVDVTFKSLAELIAESLSLL